MTSNPSDPNSLLSLPLAGWSSRLGTGLLTLTGASDPFTFSVGPYNFVGHAATSATVKLTGRGGAEPTLTHVSLQGIDLEGLSATPRGHQLELHTTGGSLDGAPLTFDEVDLTPIARVVSQALRNPRLSLDTTTGDELIIRFRPGLHADLPPNTTLSATATVRGTVQDALLSGPLKLQFGTPGLRLRHERFQRLSRIAHGHVAWVQLSPDGTIQLGGGAASVLDVAMQTALWKVARQLTRLIRSGPGFHKIRAFLTL